MTMKVIYIYCISFSIQLYIIYIIQEPLGIFSRVRAQCYLSSSEEVEVVSRGTSHTHNVTSHTRSQSGAPGPKTDLRTVIFTG